MRAALAAIVLVAAALRWCAASHDYVAQWDEAYHALVAKHLALHPLMPTLYETPLLAHDHREWTRAHVWLHKPPVALWLMAGSIGALGPTDRAPRVPSVALGTLAVLLTFAIARALWSGPAGVAAGLVAAGLHALNPLAVRLVSGTVPTDHVDAIAAFFIELAVFLFVLTARSRRWAPAAGAALGLAFLSKSLPALVAAAAAVPLLSPAPGGTWRRTIATAAVAGAAFFAVAAPWQVWCAVKFPAEMAWESAYTWRHLTEAVEGHAHEATWYLSLVPLHFGGLAATAYATTIGAVAHGLFAARRLDRGLLAALVWALLPYLVFSFTGTKVYSYTAPSVPAAALLAGYAVARIVEARAWERKFHRRVRPGLAAATWAAAALLAVHGVALAVERARARYDVCPWNVIYDYPSFRAAVEKVARSAPGPKVLFNVQDGMAIQAMYYGDHDGLVAAYPEVPAPDVVRDLRERGLAPWFFLDERGSNLEAVKALERAGLLTRANVVHVPRARVVPKVHPYAN